MNKDQEQMWDILSHEKSPLERVRDYIETELAKALKEEIDKEMLNNLVKTWKQTNTE